VTRELNEEALALLEWYALAGVDEAIDETAHNRFCEHEAPPRIVRPEPVSRPRAEPPPPPRPSAPPSAAPFAAPAAPATMPTPRHAVEEARALAAAAASLAELEAAVRGFAGCPLKATARNTCFADGNPEARIMFIGEGPGRDEDIQAKPFVGRAGQLLDRMLAAIGLDRTSAYITNVVYWRPPANRTPTPDETAVCLPFTERQIELVAPDILVFLGNAAAKHLLAASDGIMRLRGKWKTFRLGGRDYPAMPTLHPAFLLRQPAHKRLAWADFLEIKAALDKHSEHA
jgi:DNA polymerase